MKRENDRRAGTAALLYATISAAMLGAVLAIVLALPSFDAQTAVAASLLAAVPVGWAIAQATRARPQPRVLPAYARVRTRGRR
ncbi:MAG TPA: hypothetical protein VE224_06035 [Pseudolabrys sp.]|nr:hypothetical protein [Pseudolabrys sp.]